MSFSGVGVIGARKVRNSVVCHTRHRVVEFCFQRWLASSYVDRNRASSWMVTAQRVLFAKNPHVVQAGKSVAPPSAHAGDDARAGGSNDEVPDASSNGQVAHGEDGQSTVGPALTYSRTTTIHIDPETGEARNASTGETMETPLRSPRPVPSTPPPVPISEFQHLATESDLKVCG